RLAERGLTTAHRAKSSRPTTTKPTTEENRRQPSTPDATTPDGDWPIENLLPPTEPRVADDTADNRGCPNLSRPPSNETGKAECSRNTPTSVPQPEVGRI
ncbi:hypothetical protein C0J52_06111, partial [Blattella germanica]